MSPSYPVRRAGLPLFAAAICVLMTAGCGVSSNSADGMTPASFSVAARHPATVRIAATGGCDRCQLGEIDLTNAALTEAIVNSVTKSGVFSRATTSGEADYALSAQVFMSEAPVAGVGMNCRMEIGWTLTVASTRALVWRKPITSDCDARTRATPIGVQRMRFAAEYTVSENIQKAIEALSRLSLPAAR